MTLRSALAALLAAAALPAAGAGRATFALHLGSATGGWLDGGSGVPFGELLARDPLRLSAAAEAGGAVGPTVTAGLRASTLHLRAGDAGTRTTLLVARLEAVATWHPLGAGPYLRGGIGPAGLWYDVHVPHLAGGSLTAGGGAVSIAAGAALPAGGRVELRVEAEGAWQSWLPSSRGPTGTWSAGGSVGVAWR